MLFNKKKILVMSILCAISSASFMSSTYAQQQDEKLDNYELEEVVVEGKQDKIENPKVHEENILPGGFVKTESTLGILGDKQVMDTPFTQMDLTAKQLKLLVVQINHYKVY